MMVTLGTGEQLSMTDIIAMMGSTGGGSLQVVSDRPMLATSRTYNTSDDGTFGQFLDAHGENETASAGEIVSLPQLQQNSEARTNIGLLNSGHQTVVVRVRLYDGEGNLLAAPTRTLPAMTRIQLQEPFSRIAGRDDIGAGYATVTVMEGGGVVAYASVIDNSTNDPTTIPMQF
jgi:hypothetical protein